MAKKQRASERLFPKELKERADRVRNKKIRGDYFARGFSEGNVHCRACEILIVAGGKILSNYRNVELQWQGGGIHKTNLCASCCSKLDFNDFEVVEAILMSDFESWARTSERLGETAKRHQEQMKALHAKELAPGGKVLTPGFEEK